MTKLTQLEKMVIMKMLYEEITKMSYEYRHQPTNSREEMNKTECETITEVFHKLYQMYQEDV